VTRAFLSYSTKDSILAQKLTIDLRERGVEVYYADMDMAVGAGIRDELQKQIVAADCLILLLSKSSLASTWVELELRLALEEKARRDLRIFPAFIEDCDPPSEISGLKYVDLRKDYSLEFDALVKAILDVFVRIMPETGVTIARRGGSGKIDQRAGYGFIGNQQIGLHWVIDSVGDMTFVKKATAGAHNMMAKTAQLFFEKPEFIKDLYNRDVSYLGGFLEQYVRLMSVAVMEVRIEAQRERKLVGSKAVLALQRPGQMICVTAGACGGLAHWMSKETPIYQRIQTPGHMKGVKLLSEHHITVMGVAPLGHHDQNELHLKAFSYPHRSEEDFIALTSFGLPVDETTIEKIIKGVDGLSAAEIGRRLCMENISTYDDCLCAVIRPRASASESGSVEPSPRAGG
jgi:hypothetical protein